ncbi:MAG TPA: alternative ribosome rescue aminoacyl-tRNA hydrolase ArfB [Solirubrobacterales bacterium]|nr:aminoacyl-tRNA hydrolase [Solirubrobacterales bacterium]HMU25831.1 alternative ribosome rescue aminoacyl-tRNA hydrolase ArfB [Solirubrobacterales bacterium]HMX70222.1 alternative ribosome rescue aminoacyl-tRNA hydrolase ArfB [Solirubrobacterales bacterium]HMY24815.1 alternative ribosome rescue aminoacyl-tRNA hydrolase ArfB [Solirubrobacterales bacterium]HNA24582.1 alternative ribosome rescue aminoacyl-tRNA hydrolase ArfB [Solirubrobacterales bacterium]
MKPGIRPRGGPFIPVGEITLRASRSSGPGGQHANVTASRIEAVFEVESSLALNDAEKARIIRKLGPTVTAVSQDARSQTRNRDLALERLETKLAGALSVPRRRRATRPTRASKQKRLESKRHQSRKKQDRRRPGPDYD